MHGQNHIKLYLYLATSWKSYWGATEIVGIFVLSVQFKLRVS